MADLRRRKPDDDSGKQVDDDNFIGAKPERCSGDGANGSDDDQLHPKKPASGLTTAESSDHVNINKSSIICTKNFSFIGWGFYFFFRVCVCVCNKWQMPIIGLHLFALNTH